MPKNQNLSDALASTTDLSGNLANVTGPLQQLVDNIETLANLNNSAANLSNIANKSFAEQGNVLRENRTRLKEAEDAIKDDTINRVETDKEKRKEQLVKLKQKSTTEGLNEAEERLLALLEELGDVSEDTIASLVDQRKKAGADVEKLKNAVLEASRKVVEKEASRSKIRTEALGKIFSARIMEYEKIADAFDVIDSAGTSMANNFIKKFSAAALSNTEEGKKIIDEILSGKYGDATNLNYRTAREKGADPRLAFKAGAAGALALTGDTFLGNSADNNVFKNLTSGSQLGLGEGGLANKAISGMAPPWVTLVLAALNRFNAVGKKALELFEGTAGRYGYGEGFNKGEARQFLDFQQTARNMSAEYAVNLDQVEQAFKGLQEYSGVRTFGQLKKLAEATLQISNATGLATSEVTKLGSAYQKNFGYGAQESVAKAGKQLLGLMNSINSGLSSNLVLTNTEMAGLVQNLIEGTQGADVTKTLLPFIDTAYNQIKGLGIQSKVVGELLRNQMLEIKKSGAGLPGSLSSFMLGAGGLFTNRLGGAEVGIASQVGRGKFAYEQGQEMAKISTGPGREFWSSPKLLLRNDLVDLAFKLKGGDLAGLLASQSDAALSGITQRVYELYQIPGAAEAIGVSLQEITEKFSTIARNNPLQFKMLGGDLDKLSALSEYAKAEATIKTGRVGGTGPMATEEQLKAANDTRKAMVAQMTPVDRTNQLLEQLVGFVDQIVVGLSDLFSFSDEKELEVRGGLTEEEYDRLNNLAQIQQRDVEQQKQYDLLRNTQNEFRGRSAARVDPVNGKVTTTVEMDAPPYQASIVNQLIAGTSRAIGNGG